MTKKLAIALTFDYEIYFGQNYLSFADLVESPTTDLLSLADSEQIPLVFFPDVMSLFAHANLANGIDKYCDPFEKQMTVAATKGHEIGLHFHPHWLDASFSTELGWSMPLDRYSFASLVALDGGEQAIGHIKSAITKVQALAGGNFVESFRAGGYSIPNAGPTQTLLWRILLDHGISIDSSVFPHKALYAKDAGYNYLTTPAKSWWHFDPAIGLCVAHKNGELLELPRISIPNGIGIKLRQATRRLGKILSNSYQAYQPPESTRQRGVAAALDGKSTSNGLSFSFDYASTSDIDRFMFYTNLYLHQHSRESVVPMVVVCHPKAMDEEAIETIRLYIANVKKKYAKIVQFATLKEVKKMVQ